MTPTDVETAALALVAAGEEPSMRAIERYLRAHGTPCSRHTIAAFLKHMDPLPVVQPEVTPPPVTPDPVEAAEQQLRAAEQILVDARDSLTQAKMALLAVMPLRLDGVLHGSLHAHDEALTQAVWDVDSAKQHYDYAWSQREDARQRREQAERLYRRQHQETYIARTRPELVANLAHWQEQLRTASNDRMHAEAKKNYGQVRFVYEQEVAQAPWNANGTGQ